MNNSPAAQEEETEEYQASKAPGYYVTMADLMMLLVCFFVLIISMSEIDAIKYKEVAGSMKEAFGVQREIRTMDIPRGTSIIALEFSPGRPDPTIEKVIKQDTVDPTKLSLQIGNPENPLDIQSDTMSRLMEDEIERRKLKNQTQQDARTLTSLLSEEIQDGKVDVETDGPTIIIRVRERGSFGSGSAELRPSFLPVLRDIKRSLTEISGEIVVEGHTDNIPINSVRYPSNLALSADRALSVAQELISGGLLDPDRVSLRGWGEAKPKASNASATGRAENRRVEIMINQVSAAPDDGTEVRQVNLSR